MGIVNSAFNTFPDQKVAVFEKLRKLSQGSLTVYVQDFLDKAKKDFEEKWSKNPKVSRVHKANLGLCITFASLAWF